MPTGNVQSTGRNVLRTTYGQLLAEQPDREYEIVTRIRVGRWVVDEDPSLLVHDVEDFGERAPRRFLGDPSG